MLATVLAAGCGVKTVGDLDDGSESGDSSAEGSEGHTSVASQTTSASDTDSASDTGTTGNESSASVSATVSTTDPSASATDTDTDTDTDTGECPPGQGSTCDPQPEIGPDDAAWSIDGNQSFETELVDVTCTVADFQDDGTTMTIELHCDEEELAAHTIVLPHNPVTPLNLGVDTSVRLSYYAQTPFWTNYWFAIHRLDGGLVIGATEASALLPADDLFAPLGMIVQDDVCPQECSIDKCGTTRRHAIDVTVDADETTVYDGMIGVVGQTTQYTVVVGNAAGFVDFGQCTDIPGAWYRVIVYDSSEG